MKWIVCILFGFALQGIISRPGDKSVNIEFNSFYFYKGVSNDFFGGRTESLLEIQKRYPGLKWEFVLIQLKSEPGFLVSKRLVILKKRFAATGLDMNRIVFNQKAFFVDSMNNRVPPEPPATIDSVGAILEGKVISLE